MGGRFRPELVAGLNRNGWQVYAGICIGMQSAEDYRGLPLIHSGFSTRYTRKMLPRSLILLAGLVLAVYLVMHKGIIKIIGVIIDQRGCDHGVI
jgi:hypothetical protein